jgi:hypothetical protein
LFYWFRIINKINYKFTCIINHNLINIYYFNRSIILSHCGFSRVCLQSDTSVGTMGTIHAKLQ